MTKCAQFALVLALMFVALIAAFAPAQTPAQKPAAKPNTSAPAKVNGPGVKTDDGLQYWDLRVGNGETAKEGHRVRVHYTGWLANGKKFDSSVDLGQPFDFTIGNGEVIKGWDEGVAGMRVNGRRQLHIPSALAYGEKGTEDGSIPPNATLIFDIQLIAVQ
jgi:peptidylprolyl isomerase